MAQRQAVLADSSETKKTVGKPAVFFSSKDYLILNTFKSIEFIFFISYIRER